MEQFALTTSPPFPPPLTHQHLQSLQLRRQAFKVEVANLKKTRHETLVLFMGACIEPQRLAIITRWWGKWGRICGWGHIGDEGGGSREGRIGEWSDRKMKFMGLKLTTALCCCFIITFFIAIIITATSTAAASATCCMATRRGSLSTRPSSSPPKWLKSVSFSLSFSVLFFVFFCVFFCIFFRVLLCLLAFVPFSTFLYFCVSFQIPLHHATPNHNHTTTLPHHAMPHHATPRHNTPRHRVWATCTPRA